MPSPEADDPGLLFVSVSRPGEAKDRQTQRGIHSHVMHHAWASRRNAPPDGGPSSSSRQTNAVPKMEVHRWRPDRVDKGARQARSTDAVKFNVNVTPSPMSLDTRLLHSLLERRAGPIMKLLGAWHSPICYMVGEMSWTLALVDDTAMQVALMSLAQLDMNRRGSENTASLDHYTRSVALLARDDMVQSTMDAACETIVGTVLALASYDLRVHRLDRWRVHMGGIGALIKGRGGVDAAIKSPQVRAVLAWTDIVGAMGLDCPANFDVRARKDTGWLEQNAAPGLAEALEGRFQGRQGDICAVMGSACGFARLAVGWGATGWIAANEPRRVPMEDLHQALYSVIYQLLEMPRHDGSVWALSAEGAMREALRLGLLLFLSEPAMLVAGEAKHNMVVPNLRGQLPRLLREAPVFSDGSPGGETLELWVLIVGTLAEVGCDRVEMVARIRRRMSTLRLRWADVLATLQRVVWLEGVWSAELESLGEELRGDDE